MVFVDYYSYRIGRFVKCSNLHGRKNSRWQFRDLVMFQIGIELITVVPIPNSESLKIMFTVLNYPGGHSI